MVHIALCAFQSHLLMQALFQIKAKQVDLLSRHGEPAGWGFTKLLTKIHVIFGNFGP